MADVHDRPPAPGSPPVAGDQVLAAAAAWPLGDAGADRDVTPAADDPPPADAPGPADRDAAPAAGAPLVADGDASATADHHAPPSSPAPAAPVVAADPVAYASARVVVARVLGLTGARSVVDVGCGQGAWSQACRDLGVPEVVGVDGPGVAADRSVATEFVEHDPALPIDLDRRFSLAICVDVGERLAPERAPGLVADLTALAPVVLFSAAVPGQSPAPHAHDRWPEYWVALFEAHGWTCRDAIRPWIRVNEDVAWWYRQNVYLAVAPSAAAAYTSFPRLAAGRPEHPVDYLLRPPGDVMTVPPPPPEAAQDEADAGDLADADGVTGAHAQAGLTDAHTEAGLAGGPAESPDGADGRPGTGAGDTGTGTHTAGEPGAPAPESTRSAARTDEDLLFPEPPGWSALRRLAGRIRRRHRR